MVTAALFTTAKIWKQPKCPSTDKRIKQMCVCAMGDYSAIRKNAILPLATTWTDLKGVTPSKTSQTKTYFQ